MNAVLLEILYSNFGTIFLIIGFLTLLTTGNVMANKIEKLFAANILCALLLVFVDVLDSYFAHQDTLNLLRFNTSALGYTLRPVALGIFITIIRRREKIELRDTLLIWLPIIITAIIAMTNIHTHVMFYFDAQNVFHRGPLGLLPHILCIGYMFVLVYLLFRNYRDLRKGELVILYYIIAISFVSMILETFLGFKYLLTCSISCGSIFYYMYINMQVYKVDPVTGVLNRHTFNIDVEKTKERLCM